jgi:hypothetical protein
MSKHSATVDEFYATSPETAKWLLEELAKRYDLDDKTALEPCAGGFIFPTTAPQLAWTTNDLNQWTDRQPDTRSDFLETEFKRHDFVITNPPFGPNNKLAFAFLEKSAQLADTIAMIVPSSMGSLTARLHNLMPADFKLVFNERCPCQWFDLPDGSKRPVRTHGVIWERVPGYNRPAPKKPKLDARTPFFELADDGVFALRIYGDGIGDLKPHDETVGGTWIRFNFHRNKQCVGLKLIMSFPWRYLYGSSGKGRAPWDDSPGVVPSTTYARILHFTNCMAVLEGRLDPDPEVDYEDFLDEFTMQVTGGLSAPLPAD